MVRTVENRDMHEDKEETRNLSLSRLPGTQHRAAILIL